jgi:hypothetical protein
MWEILLILVVNLPLLIMRLLIWHVVQKDISIFIVKNLLVIVVLFYQLYENEMEKYTRSNCQATCQINNLMISKGKFTTKISSNLCNIRRDSGADLYPKWELLNVISGNIGRMKTRWRSTLVLTVKMKLMAVKI